MGGECNARTGPLHNSRCCSSKKPSARPPGMGPTKTAALALLVYGHEHQDVYAIAGQVEVMPKWVTVIELSARAVREDSKQGLWTDGKRLRAANDGERVGQKTVYRYSQLRQMAKRGETAKVRDILFETKLEVPTTTESQSEVTECFDRATVMLGFSWQGTVNNSRGGGDGMG
jgi:hypothetical protein